MEHYANMQEEKLKRVNAEIKNKNMVEGDLVLRYNSKLDHTFQKKFQIKWEGPFQVMEKFDNGTYQLADLDGALHANRVNGFRLKKYVARMMTLVSDVMLENLVAIVPTLTVEEDYGPALCDMYSGVTAWT